MAFRYEELFQAATGAGLSHNQWHRLYVNVDEISLVQSLIGYITWESAPNPNIQVAGYAALYWTDGARYSGTSIVGETRPILTRFAGGEQGFHVFDDRAVEFYRDSSGFLPKPIGIVYYIEPYLPPMQWRFFGGVP